MAERCESYHVTGIWIQARFVEKKKRERQRVTESPVRLTLYAPQYDQQQGSPV